MGYLLLTLSSCLSVNPLPFLFVHDRFQSLSKVYLVKCFPSICLSSSWYKSNFHWFNLVHFLQDGRTIHVGDCALFKPSHNSLPFVGLIRKLKVGKENNLTLSVNWLYRPADIKLKEGASLEAAPNEIFYSFHKDEIPAASLLHPCKVAFLPKNLELPSGISSFVCRRVYDIESKCLWWLTDQDYINVSIIIFFSLFIS